MRMLSVLHVHLSLRDGGAERQTAALVAGLARVGHRVLLAVSRGSPLERRALDAGAPIFPLGERFPMGPDGIFTWWSRGRARLLAARGAWDLVHFHSPESYGKTARVVSSAAENGPRHPSRTLVTYRGQRGTARGRAPAPLGRHHRSGGAIVAASEALWAALVREGFEEDRLSFIHPGIDMKAYAPDAALRVRERAAHGFGGADEVVGTVAVLDRDRGVGAFLAAGALLLRDRPNARFLVVGDGLVKASLQAKARRAGLGARVTFTGWREDVHRALQAFDAFVFPGEGEEVFPASLIEAMGVGVPVVVCDQPGIREIIENGKQGLLVPERGIESLARTVFRVLADPDVARRMGHAGSVRVQRFHTQAMIDAHENLYYKVAKIARES